MKRIVTDHYYGAANYGRTVALEPFEGALCQRNIVSSATREHEREQAKEQRMDALCRVPYRYNVRATIHRAHCGIDVADIATYPNAIY